MTFDEAAALRRRAMRYRHLASEAEHSPAMRLDHHAGIDTWRGPRALHHVEQLRAAQHRVHEAAEELRQLAWQLDRQADDVDAATRSVVYRS